MPRGLIIFSRFPILDTFMHEYPRPNGFRTTESLIAADILAGKDTIRVFTTHLQSVLFRSKEYHDIEIIKNVDDSIVDASRSIAANCATPSGTAAIRPRRYGPVWIAAPTRPSSRATLTMSPIPIPTSPSAELAGCLAAERVRYRPDL